MDTNGGVLHSCYRVLPNEELIIEVFVREITTETLMNHKKRQIQDELFSPEFDMLSDIRNCELKFGLAELDEYAKTIATRGDIAGCRNLAILTNSAVQVAYASLFGKTQEKRASQKVEVFSTLNSALQFMRKSKLSVKECEQVIRQLYDEIGNV